MTLGKAEQVLHTFKPGAPEAEVGASLEFEAGMIYYGTCGEFQASQG